MDFDEHKMRKITFFLVFGMWVLMVVAIGDKGITVNSPPSSSSSRRRPSVVNIGGLLTVNSVIGSSVKPAIIAAVNDVNSNPSVLGQTHLNLILHDTNCSGFLGTIEGNHLLLML